MKKILINLAVLSSFAFATAVHADCVTTDSGCIVSGTGEPVRSGTSSSPNSSLEKAAQRSDRSVQSRSSKDNQAKKSDISTRNTSRQSSNSMPGTIRQSGTSMPENTRQLDTPTPNISSQSSSSKPEMAAEADTSQNRSANAFPNPQSATGAAPAYRSTCCWAP